MGGGLVFYYGPVLQCWLVYMNRHGLDKRAMAYGAVVAIDHAIGRLGCFSAGCCYGAPAEGCQAVTFLHRRPAIRRAAHPAQIYESLGTVNFPAYNTKKHQSFKGQLFWTYILFIQSGVYCRVLPGRRDKGLHLCRHIDLAGYKRGHGSSCSRCLHHETSREKIRGIIPDAFTWVQEIR